VRLGFYPAHPACVEALLRHLKAENPGKCTIMDCCAGEGLALTQLAHGLAILPDRVYAVELDMGRAAKCRENLPGSHILGPCSFFSTQISSLSFSCIYVNAPYDSELGGGRREEQSFVQRASQYLAPKGVLVLACPLHVLANQRALRGYLRSHFDRQWVWKFPEEHRHYGEVVWIGVKRTEPVPEYSVPDPLERLRIHEHSANDRLMELGELNGMEPFELPSAWKPHSFRKLELTEQEMELAVSTSPLRMLFEPHEPPPPAQPPLPLHKGHVALMITSGMLDGIVEAPDEPPHVVRGGCKKIEKLAKDEAFENEQTGVVTTKQTFTQLIVPILRAVGPDGIIRTMEEVKEEIDGDSEGEEEE
jgi:hypothetical protein